MLFFVTHSGEMYEATDKYREALEKANIKFDTIDTSGFYDIEWEYINALQPEHIHPYMTKIAKTRKSSALES